MTRWPEPIAIVGLAGRFPGALDVGQFWTGLIGGVQSIRFLPDVQPVDPRLVRASAAAPELDGFDAEFFGLSAEQAGGCDPRALVLLECAHAAIEDAGYDVEQTTEVGLFAAAGGAVRYPAGSLGAAEPTALASRLLGLRGPSLGVQAGEAGSLVAVHLACASLLAGESELALAGGVQLAPALDHGYRWEPGDELSRDGYCRPFDRAATGTVPAAGAGMVALKRLSDALADRDRIWAVLRSSAVSNSGSIAAGADPAALAGQSAAIERALQLAGADPSELTMLEAHAAGNPARDRIELAALRAIYRSGHCALGSVKGNVGHLGQAAGVTSLIKVALSLAKQAIPVTAGYRQPHPSLELDGSAFYLPSRAVGWPRSADRPRLAGVNASDAGGTNVHAIVAEAPAVEPEPVEQRPRLIVWSARTPTAAESYRGRLAEHFAGGPDFARSVATLQGGRTAYARRGAVVAADPAEAAARLSGPDPAARITAPAAGPSRIAFLFPGQGAQQAGLAQDLYDRMPSYAKAFDECLDLFEATGLPLRRWWRQADQAQLHSPQVALPLTFAIEHALVQAWRSWGITPAVVAGLSIGELTAAHVAGVCSLAEIVPAVAIRAQGLQALPPSGVIGVAGTPAEVEPLLPDGSWIAVVTGPRQLVVAGWPGPLADATVALEQAGLSCRSAAATRAVHGPIAAAAVPAFERAMRGLSLTPPTIELYSANTGRLTSAAEATDSRFWARQLVQPVRFADAVDTLTAGPGRLLLIEVGPGQLLTSALRRHPTVTSGRHRLLPTLAHRPVEPQDQVRSALAALGTVWAEGHSVDWVEVSDLEVGRTSVPGYPFERTRLTPSPVAEPAPMVAAEPVQVVEPVQPVPAPQPVVPVHFAAPVVEFVPPVVEFVSPGSVDVPPAPVDVAAAPVVVPPAPVVVPAAPVVVPAAPAVNGSGRSPGTAARLRQLWFGVLGEPEIGPDTDFFDLGGNSLTAVELMAAVRTEFDVELRTIVLFEHPTLDALAAQIDRRVT